MAKLIVTATGSDVTSVNYAAPSAGDDEGMYLIVQVTDTALVPITGLAKSSFKVWELGDMVGASSTPIYAFFELAVAVPSVDLQGVYLIKLKVNRPNEKGSFAFGVAVTKTKATRGQTLATIVRV